MPAKIEQVCQRRRENDHVTEIASLMEGEWPCYRSGHFIGGRYGDTEVVSWRENGHFTEVLTLMEGEWSCYGGG